MILKINNIYFEKLHKRICIISEKISFVGEEKNDIIIHSKIKSVHLVLRV